ncbi:MAG: GNAT family N-acetyltransferase [Hyphomicrobiaceae bacterium]
MLEQPDVRQLFSDSDERVGETAHRLISDSVDAGTVGRLWRLTTTSSDRTIGLVGLRAPSVASLRLRAIGWRSLELTVAIDPVWRRQGLATEAVAAVAAQAGADGVTFALVCCVGGQDEAAHRLMRRCGFQELGRAASPEHPIVVYERAV